MAGVKNLAVFIASQALAPVGINRFPACTRLREIINQKIIAVIRRDRQARYTAAAASALAVLTLSTAVEAIPIEIDSDDDDDWTAYFHSLAPDAPPEHEELVIPPIVVPMVPMVPIPVPSHVGNHMGNMPVHRVGGRRGRGPIDPLTSDEESMLAGMMAAAPDPETRVKVRQRFMSKRRVRARLAMNA